MNSERIICLFHVHFIKFMSPVLNFTTPLPAGDKTPFKFVVYGDMGIENHKFPRAATTAHLVRKEIDNNDVRFVFHHGDIAYSFGYVRFHVNFFC